MRILIADDQDRVRFALRLLLAQQQGMQVVGEAGDGEALLAQASNITADLALVDWELPGLTEVGGLAALRRACPVLRIIILSSRPGVRQAVIADGVDAFVSKGEPPERLLAVMREFGAMTRQGDTHVPRG